MNRRGVVARGFTLVELLIVIGIIALLIAILMPVLSRARKQALQVSCGSNERQMAYAAIAYANDFKESLPDALAAMYGPGFNASGFESHYLVYHTRLPIVGFDTQTVWNMFTYQADYSGGWADQCDTGPGGFAFMMRDYLKNDFDVWICPDGYWGKEPAMQMGFWAGMSAGPLMKWGGGRGWSCADPKPVGCSLYYSAFVPYLWLPHRWDPQTFPSCGGSISGGPFTAADRPQAIAKSASDLPGLLVQTDYVEFYAASVGWVPQPWGCVFANHTTTSVRQNYNVECAGLPHLDLGANWRNSNSSEDLPLGVNQSHLDCRVSWIPMQKLTSPQYCQDGFGNGWYVW